MISVRWSGWDGNGLEHCVYEETTDGLVVEGVVAGNRHGVYGGHYLVRTDLAWTTREVRVDYISGPTLLVAMDGSGNWFDQLRNRELGHLQGCLDVDIGITPATNTLPIKRLGLRDGDKAEITVAYVPLPSQIEGDFLPVCADQRYTCLIQGQRYRYEGLFRSFTAELEIDQSGLVLDYPDTFRRVGQSMNSL